MNLRKPNQSLFSSQKIKMEFVDEESILGKTTSLFSRDIGEFRKLQAGSDIKTLNGKTLATSSIMVLSIELPRCSLSGSPWFQNTRCSNVIYHRWMMFQKLVPI
jgi:hypothetical protein